MLNKYFITQAAITITIVGLISRVLGFFREILFANYYGTNKDYELFLVASIIPLTIHTISIFFFQNYFIPNYAQIKKEFPDQERYFAKRTFYYSFTFSLVILFPFVLFPDIFLSFYIKEEVLETKLKIIFQIFSITILPAILSSFLSAYLNAKNKFFATSSSFLFINIATIIALVIFKSENIIEISIAYLIGTFLQLGYLLSKVDIKIFFFNNPSSDKKFLKAGFSSVLTILLIEIIGQLYMIIDRHFYSSVDSGGIAALNYATIIFLLPISIFTFSLTTAIMPKISNLTAYDNKEEMARMLNKLIDFSFYLFVPIISILILFGHIVIKIFFERGLFDSNSTTITNSVLFYLTLSMIFYVIYSFLNKYLYSLQKIRFLLLTTIFVLTIKFTLNFFLVDTLKQNGLAIATSVCYFLFFIISFYKIRKEIDLKIDKMVLKKLLIYLFNSGLSIIITHIFIKLFESLDIISDFLPVSIFLIFYILNNKILKDENQSLIIFQIKNLK